MFCGTFRNSSQINTTDTTKIRYRSASKIFCQITASHTSSIQPHNTADSRSCCDGSLVCTVFNHLILQINTDDSTDRTNSNICCTIGKLPSIHLSGNKCGKIYSIFCMGMLCIVICRCPNRSFIHTVADHKFAVIFTITDNSSHIQPCTNRNIIRDRLQRIVFIPAVTNRQCMCIR